MTKRKAKKPLKKEEIAEDYCFVCKDGGVLRICDYKQCLKAYHFNCIGKDESFLENEQNWTCGWHSCFECNKASEFHCYCCPKAVCLRCIFKTEFVNFKGKYGFCRICLKLALLLEEGTDIDSDGDCAMRKKSKSDKACQREEANCSVPPSTCASISKHNINLVYSGEAWCKSFQNIQHHLKARSLEALCA